MNDDDDMRNSRRPLIEIKDGRRRDVVLSQIARRKLDVK